MTKNELFKKENIGLTCPETFEFLSEMIGILGYSIYDSEEVRKEVFETLKILFELDILKIYKWYSRPELNNQQLTIEETLNHIDRIWFKKAEYPDFYNMMMFSGSDWYVKKTKSLGLTMTTNWEWFVENKIRDGDLEKWIEENRPKNTNHNMV